MSHLSRIFLYLSYISSCILYVLTHSCIWNIILGILIYNFMTLLHRMWLQQRGFWRYLLSLSSLPNNKPPYGPFSTVFALSFEVGFSVIPVFVYFIFIFPEIWHSVNILATLVALALEEIAIPVLFLSTAFNARTFSSGLGFSCVLFLFNPVLHNQRIYFLRSMNAILDMPKLQETLSGL